MEGPKELYHEEIKKLKDFRIQLDSHAIYKEDLESFSNDYEELVAQAKVITRVSDRLQKKLDNANIQIREQNEEISHKNIELENTIKQLVVAKVGRKASTVMFFLAIILFLSEEIFLEDIINSYISLPYLDLGIKGAIAIALKFFESALEDFFLNQEKRKIVAQENDVANAAAKS